MPAIAAMGRSYKKRARLTPAEGHWCAQRTLRNG